MAPVDQTSYVLDMCYSAKHQEDHSEYKKFSLGVLLALAAGCPSSCAPRVLRKTSLG